MQYKTAWFKKDRNDEVLMFQTASCHYHYRGGKYDHARQGYHRQVDYFAAYSPDLDKVYLVPIDHTGASEMALRLKMPKGRNQYGIKMAEDYEL